jgi:hypothetical protein
MSFMGRRVHLSLKSLKFAVSYNIFHVKINEDLQVSEALSGSVDENLKFMTSSKKFMEVMRFKNKTYNPSCG